MAPKNPHTQLSTPIERISFGGTRNAAKLRKLGIRTIRDLLWHFPARYEDYSKIVPIAELKPGEKANIHGEVMRVATRRIFPRRLSITDALVRDESGVIKAIWFNQPYLATTLSEGSRVSLAGKVALNARYGLYLQNPVYEKLKGTPLLSEAHDLKHTGRLVPVYPETEGVTSKYLRFLMKPLLDTLQVEDPLPPAIRKKYRFPSLGDALTAVHFPPALSVVQPARDRLAFDEMLLFQLKALGERRRLNQFKSVPLPFDREYIRSFIASLPFTLTGDQKIAAWEILRDLERSYPMNRLLEGDVGSGKTVVALIAAAQAVRRGYQVVFLAPTEVLAQQHYATVSRLAGGSGIRVGLLTGSQVCLDGIELNRKEFRDRVVRGIVDILIGTHAVIQKQVQIPRLALVVIDEQHRFGIEQRAALLRSSGASDGQAPLVPHLLSMTATPIPRTLALTLFGDLDISLLKEKPDHRQRIVTRIVHSRAKSALYRFIRKEVAAGRQVFVICPRIEIDDEALRPIRLSLRVVSEAEPQAQGKRFSQMKIVWAEVKAVQEEYRRLSQEVFPDLHIGMLHGKLKSAEKQRVMDDFREGRSDILVSTSVIEVGIDIPNASLMVVEGADRFGLAQLHQFRGRVGRGEHRSYCFLVPSTQEKEVHERLRALADCDDGFTLAEKDLQLRGPGEFFGTKQSGIPDLLMASLTDIELIRTARLEARVLLQSDPILAGFPLLKQRLEQLKHIAHFE